MSRAEKVGAPFGQRRPAEMPPQHRPPGMPRGGQLAVVGALTLTLIALVSMFAGEAHKTLITENQRLKAALSIERQMHNQDLLRPSPVFAKGGPAGGRNPAASAEDELGGPAGGLRDSSAAGDSERLAPGDLTHSETILKAARAIRPHDAVSPAVAGIRGSKLEHVGVNFSLFGGNGGVPPPPPLVLPGAPPRKRTRVFIACITAQTDRAVRQRSRVRETWLGQVKAQFNSDEVDAMFFVGIAVPEKKDPNRPKISDQVLQEMKDHNDIVVVDAPDTYAGLINKVRTVLQWIDNDRDIEYAAKFDDDCYVNVQLLLNELRAIPPVRTYFGNMMAGGKVLRTTRNAEPNLPRSMDWYPPYASGAGYALSSDLVKLVAYPAVKLVDMVNEDAHLGIVLLPFDVHRVATKKIHSHGIGACIPTDQMIAVHYVKDKTPYDCFVDIHKNVTEGLPICKSRYCGPAICDDEHPKGKKACKVDNPKWELIANGATCEHNPDGIERFAVGKHMVDVKCCRARCEELCECTAFDFYVATMWCNLYKTPCKSVGRHSPGGSAWKMVSGRL